MSAATTEQRVAAMFALNTAEHQLKVLHDDGLYRHIQLHKPGTGIYRYDLITWPGYLAISGDLDSYVFSRVQDMFTFFRAQQVNPSYWAEKVQDGRERTTSYSEDLFKQRVEEEFTELDKQGIELTDEQQEAKAEILEQVKAGDGYHEGGAREILAEAERAGLFSDTWDWKLADWDWHFLYCLNAIVTGIAAYDAAKTAETVNAR